MIATASQRECVLRRGPLRLYRYRAEGERLPTPVVLVPSIINTARIFDLREGQSVVQHLLDQGLDVYLIDWGSPREADACLDLGAYALGLMRHVLRAARRESRSSSAHLLGYCLGGVFSLIAGARLEGVASVLALTTPVDLSEQGSMKPLVDPALLDLGRLTSAFRVVPGALLWSAFQSLDPAGIAAKWRAFHERRSDAAWTERFLAQESWLADPVSVTARVLEDIVQRLYRENALAQGTLILEGSPLRLGDGQVPVLNLIAARDGIVPPAQSQGLEDLWGGPVWTHVFPGGHIGVTVGSRAPNNMWAVASDWLTTRQEARS